MFAFATAQVPQFPFGNATGDIVSPPSDFVASPRIIILPKPMTYFDKNVSHAAQMTNGYIYSGSS
jgi:hypothetical protein